MNRSHTYGLLKRTALSEKLSHLMTSGLHIIFPVFAVEKQKPETTFWSTKKLHEKHLGSKTIP